MPDKSVSSQEEASQEERARVAAELRKVREAAAPPVRARDAHEILPPARSLAPPSQIEPQAARPPETDAPRAPDNAAVNQLWSLPLPHAPRGLRGRLFRLFRRALAPVVDAQVAFNSRQVQLDNEILEYIEARLRATHRHYDGVLGDYGRRLEDADERHRILERELVAHVHDLVQRIDLVLEEAERGRVSLASSLRDLRARLLQLEERLGR